MTATWNPSDKNADISLSGGNLIANNNTISCGVRATNGNFTGKFYCEITANAVQTGGFSCGIANSTASLASYVGGDANGWGYVDDGKKYNNAIGAAYGSTFVSGDVISIAVDIGAGAAWFAKNGTWQNSATKAEIEAGNTTHAAFTGLSGTLFIMWGSKLSTQSVATANFGASAFSFAVPAGFTIWGGFPFSETNWSLTVLPVNGSSRIVQIDLADMAKAGNKPFAKYDWPQSVLPPPYRSLPSGWVFETPTPYYPVLGTGKRKPLFTSSQNGFPATYWPDS